VASAKKHPPNNPHTSSETLMDWLAVSANRATVKPTNPLPTSPMKIRAGGQFQRRKPRLAAARHAIAVVSPLAPCPYQFSQAPALHTNAASLPAIPSMPSMKLKRFADHTRINTAMTLASQLPCKPHLASSICGTSPRSTTAKIAARSCTPNRTFARSGPRSSRYPMNATAPPPIKKAPANCTLR